MVVRCIVDWSGSDLLAGWLLLLLLLFVVNITCCGVVIAALLSCIRCCCAEQCHRQRDASTGGNVCCQPTTARTKTHNERAQRPPHRHRQLGERRQSRVLLARRQSHRQGQKHTNTDAQQPTWNCGLSRAGLVFCFALVLLWCCLSGLPVRLPTQWLVF